MNKIIKFLGLIVFVALMYAIPIALTCGIIFSWGGQWLFLLVVAQLAQMACFIACVAAEMTGD